MIKEIKTMNKLKERGREKERQIEKEERFENQPRTVSNTSQTDRQKTKGEREASRPVNVRTFPKAT